MVEINGIFTDKKVLFLFVIILVELILLASYTILFITTNIVLYKLIIELIRNFIFLTSGVIALTIPFAMKDIETKKRETELIERITIIITELKKYFEIMIVIKSSPRSNSNITNLYVPPQFQFFKFIAKKEPEFLKKLGIDISLYTSPSETGPQFEGASLILLNTYRLSGGKIPSVKRIRTGVEFLGVPRFYEDLLKELVENAEKSFSIKLGENLKRLSLIP